VSLDVARPAPRFGVYFPQLNASPTDLERRVLAAEEHGFDSAWFLDHLSAPGMPAADCYEGWTVATFLAARTSRIRLGHLVLCDAFRPAPLLAKMAATLDVLSGGRLELGLGWGSVPEELQAWGFGDLAPAERARRLVETLTVLRLLWSGEPVSYRGEQVQLDGAICRPRPVDGQIPIHIGGAGPKLTMPIVAEHADWWNCPSYAMDRWQELRPLAGPRVRVSAQRPVALVPSAARREEVAAVAQRRFHAWGGLVVADPDELAARLVAEREQGVDMWVLQFSDFAQPETLELFMREVAPALT
jgi:alkanesulfonate monooxygenase SsuD/methylene tetrahydromethanopterin reductase-like flavin-dependent oxidoreductase (luciferase family)